MTRDGTLTFYREGPAAGDHDRTAAVRNRCPPAGSVGTSVRGGAVVTVVAGRRVIRILASDTGAADVIRANVPVVTERSIGIIDAFVRPLIAGIERASNPVITIPA